MYYTAERTVIVHPGSIKRHLWRGSAEKSAQARRALALITETSNKARRRAIVERFPLTADWEIQDSDTAADVIILLENNPTELKGFINEGDIVTLMGAYLGICVGWAEDAVKAAGATTIISKEGTIK